MSRRGFLAVFLAAFLLAAVSAAGATDRSPGTLWSEFPLTPTTTSEAPATPPVAQPEETAAPAEQPTGGPLPELLAPTTTSEAPATPPVAQPEETAEPAEQPTGGPLPELLAPTTTSEAPATPPVAQPEETAEPAEQPTALPLPEPDDPGELSLPLLVALAVGFGAAGTAFLIIVGLWLQALRRRRTNAAASPHFRPEPKQPVEESVSARDANDALTRELSELGWEPPVTGDTLPSRSRRQSSASGGRESEDSVGSGRNQNT